MTIKGAKSDGVNAVLKSVVLLPAREVTPRYIKEIKAKYNLSWNDLDLACKYSRNSHYCLHACSHPDTFLTPTFARRFTHAVARLEKERGHTHEITLLDGIRQLPKYFSVRRWRGEMVIVPEKRKNT